MRLTLRTLLAHVDDVLEPGDREEITKKLEHSDFANDLIHRMKDTVRRLRLSAPQVVGTGMGLDPNTVAEYLDNTLAPDNVADMERICLESDLHLAEVASCHRVLTMVLGEPAEVDPASRQKMYLIPSSAAQRTEVRIDGPHPMAGTGNVYVATAPAGLPASSSFTASAAEPHSADVPDYLRASAWSAYRVPLVALAAMLLLAVTLLLVTGLGGWLSGQPELTAGSADQLQANVPAMPKGTAEPDTEGATPDPSEITTEQAGGEPTQPIMPMSQSPPVLLTPGFQDVAPGLDDSDDDRYAVSEPAAPPTDESAAEGNVDVASIPSSEPIAGPVLSGIPPNGSFPADPAGAIPTGIGSMTPDEDTESEVRIASTAGAPAGSISVPSLDEARSASTDAAADAEEIEITEEVVAELGTFLDGKNALLRYDQAAGSWFRLLPRSTVNAGDRLLALPAFYPKVTMTTGFQLKLVGGTLISLGTTNSIGASAVPSINVEFGQLVIVNTTSEENELQLVLGDSVANIRLLPSSTLAVDVVRSYVPGLDPRKSPSPLVARLYLPEGSVQWDDDQGPRTIQAPSEWGIASGESVPTEFPEWIDSEPTEQRSEQVWGVPVVEQNLDATRPVGNQLLELYQSSRRREVKSLVARCSVYVGLFVPFVEALRDSDQSSMWKTHIETLRGAMALGPESADKIYQTLVEQRGDSAARDLYEMLCGYDQDQVGRTPEEVAVGPIPRLINWLEEDSLDYRVLAVQDLWEACGKRFLNNPAGSAGERARAVRVWRERLRSGQLSALPAE